MLRCDGLAEAGLPPRPLQQTQQRHTGSGTVDESLRTMRAAFTANLRQTVQQPGAGPETENIHHGDAALSAGNS